MSKFQYSESLSNVSYLTASYAFLVKAFGREGTLDGRDEDRSMAQWNVVTPHGTVEVYDYKVGKCYDPKGLARKDITDWHVQGEKKAIQHVLELLKRAEDDN